jgi:adenylyltransferase/sulfurtransferase
MTSSVPAPPSPSITVSELAANSGKVQLIDVREPFEFELARIEGAVLIPLGSLRQSLDQISTDLPVVVHCHHDSRSRVATQMLQQLGMTDVRWLEGGIDAWSREIDPSVPRY